jgi:predicted amidohydrolase YtcJ
MTITHDTPTTVLVNARIWPGDGTPAERREEAIAIGGGKILAIGSNRDVRDRFPQADEIDAAQHTVVPGLVDAHNHAARGGATWNSELHWSGLTTKDAALESIRQAAVKAGPNGWVSAIGGWHQTQFAGTWLPSRAELDSVAPHNPVYVQSLYEVGVANTAAVDAVGLREAAGRLPAGTIDLDSAGVPTGKVQGLPAFNLFLAAVGTPNHEEEIAGTRAMVHDYAALGLTGVGDPGGFGMSPDRYAALRELHRSGGLNMRMRLFDSATTPGIESSQVDEWLGALHDPDDDEWLRTVGIGEVVHFGCHDFEGLDDFAISAQSRETLRQISATVAAHGLPMHIHAVMDESIDAILDCWEDVDRVTPIGDLRFSFAHADRISPANIARAKALGVGVVIDARLAFRSSASQAVWGPEALRSAPPLKDITAAGLHLGVGSDATRASSHNPWLCSWWLVAGRSLDGSSQRDGGHLLDRERVLAAQTSGNAWFSFEENGRGTLQPGRWSDLAVLNDDYFTVPVDAIPSLRSELTIVGDRVAYSSGALTDPA